MLSYFFPVINHHKKICKSLLSNVFSCYQIRCSSQFKAKYMCAVEPVKDFHIGTYFNIVQPVVRLQNEGHHVSICITDTEALASFNQADVLCKNIKSTISLLLACGVNPNVTTIYLQSEVPEILQLTWLLNCIVSKDFPVDKNSVQIADKSTDIKLGLYMQPIFRGCTYLINKSMYILTDRNMERTLHNTNLILDVLNERYPDHFPLMKLWSTNKQIYSLKDPTEIMDSADANNKNKLHILDSEEIIINRIKKAVTDFNSEIYYDKRNRPGVSNLLNIHSLLTGQSLTKLSKIHKGANTADYKTIVADALINHFRSIKKDYSVIVSDTTKIHSIIDTGKKTISDDAQIIINDLYKDFGFNFYDISNLSIASNEYSANTNKTTKQIFSGIQPTGILHLGNYIGAVRNWINLLQGNNDVIISIVDQHAITVPQRKEELQQSILMMAASLIACGLNPDECILFQQSRVCEHAQLYGVLANMVTVATLARQAHFKDKINAMDGEASLGLFSYPVLQAADILLYKTTHVPVGEDQKQHIELARDISSKFNKKYGLTFIRPHPMILENSLARLKSLLQPNKKMSKSETDPFSRIEILDSPEDIRNKIQRAVVEKSCPIVFDQERCPGVSNLMTIHSAVSGDSFERISSVASGMDHVQYKDMVYKALVGHLSPISDRVRKLMGDKTELHLMLESGARKAKARAEVTMHEVNSKLPSLTRN